MGSFLALAAWAARDWLLHGPEPLRRQLQDTLAISVEWNSTRRGSPFHREFHGVKIHDAERGSFLLSARAIDWQVSHDRHIVTLQTPTVNRTQIARMAQLAHDRLCQQPWLLDQEWHVNALSFHLRDPQMEPHHGSATLKLAILDDIPTAQLQVALSSGVPDRSMVATLKRVERNGRMVSEIEVDATDQPLPRSFFCWGNPWESALNSDSQFQGNCWVDVLDGNWETDVVGIVGPLDLAPLGRLALQESVRGTANVRIIQALFRNGELRQLDCYVTADAGAISGRALESVAKAFGLRISGIVESTANWRDRSFEFDHLAFRLTFKRHRLTVRPASLQESAILWSGGKSLLEVCRPVQEGNSAILERLFLEST